MSKEQKNTSSNESNLLVGSGLFLFLVIYFNLRSNYEMNVIDYTVIIFGVLFVIYALVQKFSTKKK